MNRTVFVAPVALAAVLALAAHADEPLIDLNCRATDGADTVAVRPGRFFDAVVSASSALPIEINSALFRLVLTTPGVIIQDYDWAAPFTTGGFTDFSLTGVPLPSAVVASTLQGPTYPAGVNDVEFGNFLLSGTADLGELVTVHLRLPADAQPGSQFFVVATPDTFALGFMEFSAQPHAILRVKVTPSPDLNHDLQVDGADLGILLAAWSSGEADLNGDGVCDGADLGILLSEWGTIG